MEMLIKTDEEKEKLLNRLGLLFSRASTIAELEVKWLYQLYLIDSVMGRVKIDEFVASTHMVYPCQNVSWLRGFSIISHDQLFKNKHDRKLGQP